MTPSRSEFIAVRGLQLHIRHWGRQGAPVIFMLHGWMDVSASFQFVVDALAGDWHVIAPDWRGFGLSGASAGDTYWFPDYVADLDALLQHYAPERAVDLLGHSMGANVACIYAGARPERIKRLINLEGIGLRASTPQQTPGRYATWLEALRQPQLLRSYPSQQAVAKRLQKTNPRLSDEHAYFLSGHWAAPDASGQWHILADSAHKNASPLLYQEEEILACWSAITAPVLWLEGAESKLWQWLGAQAEARAEIERRLGFFADVTRATLPEAGHMLHHDQALLLAQKIEHFLA